ncbi:MAG: hypothetical protein HY370_00610 [Proteobacteria bacterium]|nr:hypothetical protein [Pseudomonadota bacterium]
MRTEGQTRQLKRVMSLSGMGLTAAGLVFIFFPSTAALFGLTKDISPLLGGVLFVAGIGDFLMARFIFKTKDRV